VIVLARHAHVVAVGGEELLGPVVATAHVRQDIGVRLQQLAELRV
jgi:hypothetical protein